jgi:23S rRNA pseudouridine2604 synthase
MDRIRLSKLMSEQGLCSRREADKYIERGWVFVDGERISELGTKIYPTQKIKLDKAAQAQQRGYVTILLNKPIGYVSGQPEPGYKPAISLIKRESQFDDKNSPQRFSPTHLKNLAPAGRLDIDSKGLLIFTQDGRIAKQLIGADSKIDKEYLVRVAGRLPKEKLALLNYGLSLDGKPLKHAQVSWQNQDQLRFILHEGKKRQIRRMCELVDLKVIGLKRVRIGKVKLADLSENKWRYLRYDEYF